MLLFRFIRSRNLSDAWLIAFTVPWCGHCHKLGPVWERVASRLRNTPIRVGRVDSQAHRTLAAYYQVHGYPTIKLYDSYTLSAWPRVYQNRIIIYTFAQPERRRAVPTPRGAHWGRHHWVRQTRLRTLAPYPLVGQAVWRGRFAAFEFSFLPLCLCASSPIKTFRFEHKHLSWSACLRSRAPRLCTLITFKLSPRRDGNFDLNLS